MAALPAEYRAEPALALAGGADGMDFIRTLLRDAPAQLSDAAVLVLEIGNEREHFEAAFPRLEAVWLETSAGDDQVLLVTREACCHAAPRRAAIADNLAAHAKRRVRASRHAARRPALAAPATHGRGTHKPLHVATGYGTSTGYARRR